MGEALRRISSSWHAGGHRGNSQAPEVAAVHGMEAAQVQTFSKSLSDGHPPSTSHLLHATCRPGPVSQSCCFVSLSAAAGGLRHAEEVCTPEQTQPVEQCELSANRLALLTGRCHRGADRVTGAGAPVRQCACRGGGAATACCQRRRPHWRHLPPGSHPVLLDSFGLSHASD